MSENLNEKISEPKTPDMGRRIEALSSLVPGFFSKNCCLVNPKYPNIQNLPPEYKDLKTIFSVAENRLLGSDSYKSKNYFGYKETDAGYKLTYGKYEFPFACKNARQVISLLALTDYTLDVLRKENKSSDGILANSETGYFYQGNNLYSATSLMPFDYLTAVFDGSEQQTWSVEARTASGISHPSLDPNYYLQFAEFVKNIRNQQDGKG